MICIKELIIEDGEFTNITMFNTVVEYLKSLDALSDAIDILDYNFAARRPVDLIQDRDYEIFTHVNTGGCEGVYIDCYLENGDEKIALGTFKTLEEGMEGYMLLGKLAGTFVLAGDNYLWFNEHKFKLK